MALAGNQNWAHLPPHSAHSTPLAGPRSYFVLHPFGNYLCSKGIAMFMSFDLVILFLEIIYRFMVIFNNSVSGYVHVIIVIN